MEKEFKLSEKEQEILIEGLYFKGCSSKNIKEFINRENTEIFTEGFWNYVWVDYFNEEDEETFQEMIKHIEKRVKEKRDKLVGKKFA